jgi:NitT/TauT family transport system substrate-binding protein
VRVHASEKRAVLEERVDAEDGPVELDRSAPPVHAEQTRDAVVLSPGEEIFSGGQCYMGNREMLELEDSDAPDLVRRYLSVIRRSVDEIIADQENDFSNIIATVRENYEFAALDDDAIASESLHQYVESWTLDGEENIMRTTDERWQGVYEELVEAGSAPSGLDPTEWYTNEYIE